MDAESLAQIEQIVSTALGGWGGPRRQETDPLATTLRQPFRESLGAFATSLREMFDEKMEELKRHERAYAEELCRKLDLLIESQRGLYEALDHLEASIDRKSSETKALIRSMMGQSNPQSNTQPRPNPT